MSIALPRGTAGGRKQRRGHESLGGCASGHGVLPKEGGIKARVVWSVCGGEVSIGLERLRSLLNRYIDVVELGDVGCSVCVCVCVCVADGVSHRFRLCASLDPPPLWTPYGVTVPNIIN
jgi:hypothetical protein